MKNIVVWGLGNHSIKNIVPVIHASQTLSLYGLCSRDSNVLDQNAKEYDCKIWESEEQMLADNGVDIVFLSTPIGLHFQHGMQVLKSNKHLWCEKPLTSDINDTNKLVSYSKKNNLMLAEGFMYLYHPQFNSVKDFIHDEIQNGVISLNIKFGIPFLEKPGFRMKKELGGGAFWDVGTYPISAVPALFPEHSLEFLSSEIRFEKGYEVDISGNSSIMIDSKHNVTLEWAIGTSYRNEIDVWGKNQSLFTDKFFSKPKEYTPEIQIRDKTGMRRSVQINVIDHFESMLDDFYKSLDDDFLMNQKRDEIIARSFAFDKIRNFNS